MGKRQLGIRKPIEVAVIGGGCASIAAAFELTQPQTQGRLPRYDLSGRLAPRRKGIVRPWRCRSHRRARSPRLAGLLRQCVSVAAPVLRRTERKCERTRSRTGMTSSCRIRTSPWRAIRRKAAGSTGPHIFLLPRDFPAIPWSRTNPFSLPALLRSRGRASANTPARPGNFPDVRARQVQVRIPEPDRAARRFGCHHREGGKPVALRRAGLGRGSRRSARAGGSGAQVDRRQFRKIPC